LPPEAQESAVAFGPRPEALLVVIAVALLLIIGPALVGALSMLNPHPLSDPGGWAKDVLSWLYLLTNGRLVLTLPLAAMVARANEDS
jgi:hypothetical protein